MNRMGGGEYLGLTMKYLFGQETAHLMLDVLQYTDSSTQQGAQYIPHSAAPDVTAIRPTVYSRACPTNLANKIDYSQT